MAKQGEHLSDGNGVGPFSPLGDMVKHHERRERALAEMLDECRWLLQLLRSTGMTEAELAEQGRQMVSSSRARAEMHAFEEGIIERIATGELFESDPTRIVRAVLERLIKGAFTPDVKHDDLQMPEIVKGKDDAAQEELAQITAQFLSTKHISEATVWPWLAKAAKTEGFRRRWSQLFRSAEKPHNRLQFEFCLTRLITLDEQMAKFAATVGPSQRFENDGEFEKRTGACIEEVCTWSPVIAGVLERVKPWFGEARNAPNHHLNRDAWTLKRMEDPEQCVECVMPYLHAEWDIFKKINAGRIAEERKQAGMQGKGKMAWADVRPSIRNCARTIYGEFQAPPITKQALEWMKAKHT